MTKIKVRKNGPYLVTGTCTVTYQAPAAANTSPGVGVNTIGC